MSFGLAFLRTPAAFTTSSSCRPAFGADGSLFTEWWSDSSISFRINYFAGFVQRIWVQRCRPSQSNRQKAPVPGAVRRESINAPAFDRAKVAVDSGVPRADFVTALRERVAAELDMAPGRR